MTYFQSKDMVNYVKYYLSNTWTSGFECELRQRLILFWMENTGQSSYQKALSYA